MINYKFNKIYGFLIIAIIKLLSSQSAIAENKFLCWEMKDDNGNLTYMLGSIHMGSENMYPLPQAITDAFNSSQSLVLEINMNDIDPTSLMQKAMLPDGKTLQSVLNKKNYDMLKDNFEAFGLNIEIFNSFKPWFVAIMASTMSFKDAGYSPSYGIDVHFLRLANEKKLPVDQLESMDIQIDIFDQIPDSLSNNLVEYLLAENIQDSSAAQNIFDAFLSGDEQRIEQLILNSEQNSFSELITEKMIYGRNINMSQKIEELHNSGRINFVIAGAAHFVGERGIIDLLKKKGKYKINKI